MDAFFGSLFPAVLLLSCLLFQPALTISQTYIFRVIRIEAGTALHLFLPD